jgi:hypothetical protein
MDDLIFQDKPRYCLSPGTPEGYAMEFINGNTLDCRRANLRWVKIEDIQDTSRIDSLTDDDVEDDEDED